MFMLFTYEMYEERGGWNDFNGIFASVLEAKIHEESNRGHYSQNNGQTATMKIVATLDVVRIGPLWNDWEHKWIDSNPSSP